MKVDFKYWSDTKNVDILLTPESENEKAMLGLIRDRDPLWGSRTSQGIGEQELVFPPPDSK